MYFKQTEADALDLCRRLNRNAKIGDTWCVVEGHSDDWAVIHTKDAIESGMLYQWEI